MKISLNWMRELGTPGLDVSVDELVRRIGAQLGAVEGVENLGEKYQGIVIAKVVKCVDHPNADRLHVCTIDDGGNTPDVKRDENGHVQVVCGAPNVREGMLVAWLPPGATVPESVGTEEPFVLGARELRGVVSNGMLASPKELALGEYHEGILEIHPDEWSPNKDDVRPGADFAKVFGLDDYIIDIENKMFTHRPDCFGQLGVAREIAGISGQQFTSPAWYLDNPSFPSGEGLPLEVINESPELVPRLMTLTMKNVKVAPSPLWLQCALVRVGARPINNVVDATNYVMLLTAQPTHAYDYDKIRGHQLVARMAKPGEEGTFLNNKTYTLDSSDIVIADGEGPIGLAGIIGGGDSQVTDATTNLVLECANFDMYNIRRSSMRHGIFTDALTRFNKGQSSLQNDHVLHLLMQSIQDMAGGEVAGQVTDSNTAEGRAWVHPPVPVTTQFVNTRLGFDLNADDMKRLLENVECEVAVEGDTMKVTAPFWRTDIETREDVVEEIGRLYGFDHLPLELPRRGIKPVQRNGLLDLKATLRDMLSRAGASEVLNYSFVNGDLLEKVRQDTSKAFSISNALSPDLQYYRLSLTPSLLEKVHPNIKAGYDSFALFELGKSHCQDAWDEFEPTVPKEVNQLAVVLAYGDKAAPAGSAYYQARRYLDVIAPGLASQLVPLSSFEEIKDTWGRQLVAPYEPARSAVVVRDGVFLGVVGEFRAGVRRSMKLPIYCAGLELNIELLQSEKVMYNALSRFPTVWQDLTLKVASTIEFAKLQSCVDKALGANAPDETHVQLEGTGIYQSADDPDHKNITFRIRITGQNRTLTDQEVSKVVDAMAAAAQQDLGAERI